MDLIELHQKIYKDKEKQEKHNDILKKLLNNLQQYVGQPNNVRTQSLIVEQNRDYLMALVDNNTITENNGNGITKGVFQINNDIFIVPN